MHPAKITFRFWELHFGSKMRRLSLAYLDFPECHGLTPHAVAIYPKFEKTILRSKLQRHLEEGVEWMEGRQECPRLPFTDGKSASVAAAKGTLKFRLANDAFPSERRRASERQRVEALFCDDYVDEVVGILSRAKAREDEFIVESFQFLAGVIGWNDLQLFGTVDKRALHLVMTLAPSSEDSPMSVVEV